MLDPDHDSFSDHAGPPPGEKGSGPASGAAGGYTATMLCAEAMYWSNEQQQNGDDPDAWGDLPEEVQHTWIMRAEGFLEERGAV